jgi:putative ABC transport system permease protein
MILPKLVLSNLAVHRIRAALTISAIALSVSLVVAVTTGYNSAIAAATKFLGYYMGTSDLQVTRSKGDPHGTFSEKIADQLRSDSRVKLVITRYGGESLLLDDKGRKLAGRPIDVIGLRRPQDTSVETLQMESGKWFDSSSGNYTVVDQVLAERLKLSVGGHITLAGPDKPLRLEVVGVVHKPAILASDVQTAYVPLETLQRFSDRPGQINRVMITLKHAADADAFKAEWLPKVEAIDPLLAIKSAGDMRKQMDQNLAGVHFLSYLGGATAMLAATFIIFSALSMGVNERQRTLAMLRAIGAFKGQLAALVVIEGVLLAVAGVSAGVPLGWLWVKMLATWKSDFFTAGVVVNWSGVAFGALVSIASALLASLLPAYTASRVDPLEAMAPLAKPPESRLPLAATLAGLVCISIDSLLIFLPTSREVKFYGHFALGLPSQMLGFFLLAPLVVWTFDRAGGWLLARALALQPALLRQQLSSGIWRAAGTGAALMVGLAILVVMQVQGHSALQSWRLPNKFPDIFIWSPSGTSLAAERKLEQTPGIRRGELLPIAVTAALVEHEQIDVKGANLVPSAAMFFGVDPDKALNMLELEFRDDNGNTAPPQEQKRLNRLALEELKLGRHLIITDEYRRLLGKKRGDKLTIRTPLHGDVDYAIAGVVWSPGIDVIVSMFDMDRQFDQRTATSVFGSLEDASRDFGVNEATFFAANLDYGVDKNKLVEDMQRQAASAADEPTATPSTQPATAPSADDESLLGGAKRLFDFAGRGSATKPATRATNRAGAVFGLKQLLGMSGMQAGDVRLIKWQIQNGFERVLLLLSTVAFASMAVAALGVTNTIMASIRSRRWQFGILRSVGVTRGQLLRLVLAEALLLGLVGCALGLAAGFQMSLNANGLARYIVGFALPFTPPWETIGIGTAIVVVTAVLASLWPAASVATAEPLSLLQAGRAAA